MVINKNLLGVASIYLGANIINAAIPFLLIPVITRVLNPVEYGIIAMFQAITVGLGAFTGLSVHGAVSVRFFKSSRETFPQFVAVCLMILLASSILTALIIMIGSTWVGEFTGLSRQLLLLAVMVSAAQFVVNIRLIIWQSCQEPIRYGVFQITQTGINAGVSLYLIFVLHWAEDGRIWGISSAILLFAIVSLLTLQYNGWLLWKWNAKYAREALGWGIPLIPHVMGGIAITVADRFIVTKQLGVETTGIYFVAIQLAMPIIIIGDSFNRAFRPWLYAKLTDKKDADAVVGSYLAMIGIITCGMVYILILLIFFPIVIGVQYQGARGVVQVLILGNIFQILYYTVSNYILFAGKTGFLSIITLLTGIIYVFVGWFAVGFFGTMGLAISITVINAVYFLLIWWISIKLNPKPWFDLEQLAVSAKCLLSGRALLRKIETHST